MVVFPVPGFPVNTKCNDKGSVFRSCCFLSCQTRSRLEILRKSRFTGSKPIKRISSAFTSSRVSVAIGSTTGAA